MNLKNFKGEKTTSFNTCILCLQKLILCHANISKINYYCGVSIRVLWGGGWGGGGGLQVISEIS